MFWNFIGKKDYCRERYGLDCSAFVSKKARQLVPLNINKTLDLLKKAGFSCCFKESRIQLISWLSLDLSPWKVLRADLQSENTMMPSEWTIFVHMRYICRAVLIAMSSHVKLDTIFPAGTLCFEVELFGYVRKTPDPNLLESESEEPLVQLRKTKYHVHAFSSYLAFWFLFLTGLQQIQNDFGRWGWFDWNSGFLKDVKTLI